MTDSPALRANIWKLYLLKATMGAFLVIPVIVPFFEYFGLTLTEIFTLLSIFSVGLLVWELPSGYIADRWGRKQTAVVAASCYFAGALIFSVSSGFWGFAIAWLLLATGVSFYSGSLEALTYDTLLELNRAGDYRRVNGNQAFMHFGCEALGSLVGGALAIIHVSAAMWATLIPFGIGFLVALNLTEPPHHKLVNPEDPRSIKNIVFKSLITSTPLRSIIALHAVIGTLMMLIFWFTQPYQQLLNLPLVLFGVTHAIIVATGAITAKLAHTLEKRVSDQRLLTIIAIVMIVCLLALSIKVSPWFLLFFLFSRGAWGMLNPITSDIVNRLTTSDIRATVLSVKSLCFRSLFAVASPIVGYAADILPLQQAMLLTGIAGAAVCAIVFWLMRGIWQQLPSPSPIAAVPAESRYL